MRTELLAPAKINLCLHVTGRRPDGYHELGMVMQRVSLFDRITLELDTTPGVRTVCPGVDLVPGQENIAAKAAGELLGLAGGRGGVTVQIDKAIPVAAGLGGGSSDAAAVLEGMNRLLGLGLPRERLMEIGLGLGADVPFFLLGESAWATGIGEKLRPLPDLPEVWYVLVNPGVAVSTAWVYGNLGLTSNGPEARLPRFSRTVEGIAGLLHNDLEPITVRRYPVVLELKRRLLELGAAGALMSGSGPTVFGLFTEEAPARQAAAELPVAPGGCSFVVRSLRGDRHEGR